MKQHTDMAAHDGYAAHSHEPRPGHLAVARVTPGCRNPGHAAEPAGYCAGCARDCEAELTALNDRYMRLLGERAGWERQARAAARREAQDHMRAFAHLILPGLLDELMNHVRPALYRASEADPAMGRRQLDRSRLLSLKTEAERALRAWDERTSMNRLPADFAADPREAEITRLRQVITAAGQQLHREQAPPSDGFTACPCRGCNVIRDMDTVGLPEAEISS